MIPIVQDYCELIKSGMSVLEVGCGSWNTISSHCEKGGARYEGLDAASEYFDARTVATRIENLSELSFPDEEFDLVIATQSMEHWAENGCTLEWGLYQCFRVCKRNGKVLVNVPIHFHGTAPFMLGKIAELESLFRRFSGEVRLEKWAVPSDPNPALFPFAGYWKLRNRPAYVLDVVAVKDLELPTGLDNTRARRGRLAQIFEYPVSFNVYRVLRKAGVMQLLVRLAG